MDRWTERFNNDGEKAIAIHDESDFPDVCFEGEREYDVMNALADYEDLEEQGLLVKLPCKVGDTVYKFWYYDSSPYKIQQHVIRTLSEICELIESKKLGKSVFLTREEAEKKLKELKNEI